MKAHGLGAPRNGLVLPQRPYVYRGKKTLDMDPVKKKVSQFICASCGTYKSSHVHMKECMPPCEKCGELVSSRTHARQCRKGRAL